MAVVDPWDEGAIINAWAYHAQISESCNGDIDRALNLINQPDAADLYVPFSTETSAWSKGWSIYYQAAVREWRGEEIATIFHTNTPFVHNVEQNDFSVSNRTDRNEYAIASALWDIADAVNDGQDKITQTHAPLLQVFTSEEFEEVGEAPEACTFGSFLTSWWRSGNPLTDELAAAVDQNVDGVP